MDDKRMIIKSLEDIAVTLTTLQSILVDKGICTHEEYVEYAKKAREVFENMTAVR